MSLERWTEETMKSPDQLLKDPTSSALCIFGTKHSALFILRAPDPLFNHAPIFATNCFYHAFIL